MLRGQKKKEKKKKGRTEQDVWKENRMMAT